MDYATYQTRLQTLMIDDGVNADFAVFLPSCIEYAEERIYQELFPLGITTTITSASTTVSTRKVDFGSGAYLSVQAVNLITPAGVSNPDIGTRVQLQPASLDFITAFWPSVSSVAQPQFFAALDDHSLVFAPVPDAAYTLEVTASVRPAALSSTNTTTLLTLYYPQLFLAASMVYAAGYQKNFGAQSDDPKAAMSWETQYQTLLTVATKDEMRKRLAVENLRL